MTNDLGAKNSDFVFTYLNQLPTLATDFRRDEHVHVISEKLD